MNDFFSNKAISPVVAISLLLVVAVVSVVSFQNWFGFFSSNIFVSVEGDTQSFSQGSFEVVGSELYVSAGEQNLYVNKVEVNGVDCSINQNFSGVEGVDISDCLNGFVGEVEVVVYTDGGCF